MPLRVVDEQGRRIPPERWTADQRARYVREILHEQRDNLAGDLAIGHEALAEAEGLAKDDAVLLEEVRGVKAHAKDRARASTAKG
jgi:hypothetical protein